MFERRTWASCGTVALALAVCALLIVPGASLSGEASTLQATAPTLGTAASFAVLGGQTVTNTGPTKVDGNLGVSPGSAVTGFPPGIVTGGTIHATDQLVAQAQSATTTAYNNLAGQAVTATMTGQNLGGKTLTAGVYNFTSSAQLTGTLTLDAGGKADAVFVFQIGTKLTTASNSRVLMTNGGSLCHVFWQVGSSATLGTTTSFVGNILALTSISLDHGAILYGRALARNGEVTMDDNTISAATCGTGGTVPTATPGPATKTAVAAKTATAAAHKTATAAAHKTAISVVLGAEATASPTPASSELPRTGDAPVSDILWVGLLFGALAVVVGLGIRQSQAARRLRP